MAALQMVTSPQIQARLTALFSLDTRYLVVLRVGLGVLLLSDLVKRALTLTEHYSDRGVLPRQAFTYDPSIFRAYLLSGRADVQALLFMVAGLAALMLALGYRTRLAAAVSLFLLVSLQVRNPLACHTGDAFLTVLVFWAILLPLACRFSLDRRRAGSDPPPQVVSIATAAFLVQIAGFYLSAGLLKYQEDVWRRGEALAIFFNATSYTTDFGAALARFPAVGRLLTYGTLFLEIGGPLLLMLPVWTGLLRTALVSTLLLFHLGIELSVHIGIFQQAAMLAIAAFLPAAFWDRVEAALAWLESHLSPSALGRVRKRRTEGPAPMSARSEPLLQAAAGGALTLVLVTNAYGVAGSRVPLPDAARTFLHHIGLEQKWVMFTSIDRQPLQGWFLVVGQLANGTRVDVLLRQPFTEVSKPARFSETFVNHNSRRYWLALSLDAYEGLRPYLANYLCRQWAAEMPQRLTDIAILRVPESGGEQASPPRLLIRYRCP